MAHDHGWHRAAARRSLILPRPATVDGPPVDRLAAASRVQGGHVRSLGAGVYLMVALAVGALLGGLPLSRPQQLVGSAPWVTDVSAALLAVVVALGGLFGVVSLTWLRRSGPGLGRWPRAGLATVVVAMTVVAGWSSVSLSSLSGDPVIPIFAWTWPALTTAVAAGVLGFRYGRRAGVQAGLIAVAPVAALDALGWSLFYDDAIRALPSVLILDGFGVALGLFLGLIGRGRVSSRPVGGSA